MIAWGSKPAWESARQEASASFGNDGMYMEKLIEEPRHIEIQTKSPATLFTAIR